MEKEYLNPPGIPVLPGFHQVVTAQGGKAVFIAGQVALDADGQLVGKGNLRAQTEQVFKNIGTALAAVGWTADDVMYVVDFRQMPCR